MSRPSHPRWDALERWMADAPTDAPAKAAAEMELLAVEARGLERKGKRIQKPRPQGHRKRHTRPARRKGKRHGGR